VNVSLPTIAAHAIPAKNLPAAATNSGKFSTVLAEAQDPPDSTSDVLNQSGSHAPKKTSVKSDKNNLKSFAATDGSTLSKTTPAVNSAVHEIKAASTSAMRPSWQNAFSQEMSQSDDADETTDGLANAKSDSDLVVSAPALLAMTDPNAVSGSLTRTKSTSDASTPPLVSGTVNSGQPETKSTDSPEPVADRQQVPVSSTNLLSTWAAGEEATSFKSLVAPGVANVEASAAPNGKLTTSGTKTASADTAHGTTSTLDTKAQAGFTFLQSHAAASITPPIAPAPKTVVRPGSNSDTSHEVLQGRTLSGSSTGKQEKAVTQAFAGTPNDDLDGASNQATQLGKAGSLSSAAAPGDTGNAAIVGAPSLIVSTQISSPALTTDGQTASAGASPKTSDALTHSQLTTAAEDAEAAVEATAISASSPLHTAKLVAGVEQSELRMGLRTGEFGNVDIRTSLVRNQFTAEISVERGELGRALAAELPSLQHRLSEQHMPAASITVQDQSGSSSSGFHQGSRSGQNLPPVSVSGSRAHEDSSLSVLPLDTIEATARLDIHM
jgi:hypothetical protein